MEHLKHLIIIGVLTLIVVILVIVLITGGQSTKCKANGEVTKDCPVETPYGKQQFCNVDSCENTQRASINSDKVKFNGSGESGGFLFILNTGIQQSSTDAYGPWRLNSKDVATFITQDDKEKYGFGNPSGLNTGQIFFMDRAGTTRWVKNKETVIAIINNCLGDANFEESVKDEFVHTLSLNQSFDFINNLKNNTMRKNDIPLDINVAGFPFANSGSCCTGIL